jgi:16S rRNA C1402 N4-methylase RsmH
MVVFDIFEEFLKFCRGLSEFLANVIRGYSFEGASIQLMKMKGQISEESVDLHKTYQVEDICGLLKDFSNCHC